MSEIASIDDLLHHEEEPPPARHAPRRGLGPWVWTVLIALGLTAVTVVGLRIVGVGLPVVVVFAGFLALLTLRRFTAQVAAPPPGRAGGYRRSGGDPAGYDWGPEDGLRTAVAGWERRLGGVGGETRDLSRTVQALIGELADERLRQRHGCTRSSDPVRARTLLGDLLWKFLTAARPRKPTPRDCAAIAARLEEL
ncbi:hypothetical protein SAMN05444365_103296 [Micromonospora pattaloongensis]|uniref:Uncharacterized protein n=1 Tax=Micromonospora pattaloongensis TaxID=405436 RepID=A0A1H3MAG8_9ACTN|nr:hypothetical protein [Micromonospora pattaloongensis]SDY73583.1 hypothetical protein SAMN05444365_103296 [Micromonospora pattaloongensis]